jgi:protein FRG1
VNDLEQLVPYPIPDLYEDGSPAPTITNQVFVGARVVGSSTSFTLKSSLGKYFSADKFGVVSIDREAVSMIEEWKPTFVEGGVAFQNAYDKFLMVDEIAGGGGLTSCLAHVIVVFTYMLVQVTKYVRMPTV